MHIRCISLCQYASYYAFCRTLAPYTRVIYRTGLNYVCGVYNSHKAAYPCRMCWTTRDDLSDPTGADMHLCMCQICNFICICPVNVSDIPRTTSDMERRVTPDYRTIIARAHGTVVPARERLKAISCHPFINPLWSIPWGATEVGVFGGTPPRAVTSVKLGPSEVCFHVDVERCA